MPYRDCGTDFYYSIPVQDFLHEHPGVRQQFASAARLGLSVGLETTGVSHDQVIVLGAVGQKWRTSRIEEFRHETISTYAKCEFFVEDE